MTEILFLVSGTVKDMIQCFLLKSEAHKQRDEGLLAHVSVEET